MVRSGGVVNGKKQVGLASLGAKVYLGLQVWENQGQEFRV